MTITAGIYRPKTRKVQAVQFNGKNSTDISAWVTKNIDPKILKATARGTYVALEFSYYKIALKKGDWIVLDASGEAVELSDEKFKSEYQPVVSRKK